MHRHGARTGMVAALVVSLALWGLAAGAQAQRVASVSAIPTGQPLPAGFLGVSLEYRALHLYAGEDPGAVDPVLVRLLAQLAPGQAPVLRIGGDSTDGTWWPLRGVIPPGGIYYPLSQGWLRTTRALAGALRARLILGVNLAAGRPALAAAEARALLAGIGSQYVEALEIGNEPDLYGAAGWYRLKGRTVLARSRRYDLGSFIGDFSRWREALPSAPLAGPAFSGSSWMGGLSRFLSAEPGLAVVTYHRYPLRGCLTKPRAPGYASIANLLADGSASGLARGVAGYAAVAHAHGLPFRIGEMNSASCGGRKGTSDTFASALWVLDTLFNLASVGVDGVNIHSLPGASYELFSFSRGHGGAWRAMVHPEYYGMLLFAQAFPVGAQLLPVSAPAGPVKVWATQGTDGHIRVVAINKSTSSRYTFQLQVPGATQGTLEYLLARGAAATGGVTLGGQSFGAQTTTGAFPGPQSAAPIAASAGSYSISLPPASAALLTQ